MNECEKRRTLLARNLLSEVLRVFFNDKISQVVHTNDTLLCVSYSMSDTLLTFWDKVCRCGDVDFRELKSNISAETQKPSRGKHNRLRIHITMSSEFRVESVHSCFLFSLSSHFA